MATVEKIRRDIEKTKEKISEQQKRLRSCRGAFSYRVFLYGVSQAFKLCRNN